jgi:hypothetical protein
MAGVLPENTFLVVREGRITVDVVGDDPDPVVVAVATAPFLPVLEAAVEALSSN